MAKRFGHLQKDIDEWKRQGRPTELAFHHVGNLTAQALITELPEHSPSLLGGPDYENNVFYYLYTRYGYSGASQL